MTDLRTAAEMALEALDQTRWVDMPTAWEKKADAAVSALRAALASNPAPAIDTSAGRVDAVDKRPECWSFAMEFLGKPEAPIVEAYVAGLEAEIERLRAEVEALRKDAERVGMTIVLSPGSASEHLRACITATDAQSAS